MKKIDFIMGMPVIIEIADIKFDERLFEKVFDYFRWVDEKFSTFKEKSEITLINKGKVKKYSKEMDEIFKLAEKTKKDTLGYFDIKHDGKLDPSGIVKGWAIYNGSEILKNAGVKNYYVEIAGDIQTAGVNKDGKKWVIGIRNPFKGDENVKVIHLSGEGIATSGTYERGNHIYNPKGKMGDEIISITVIGPNIYEADRFATPAFVMGQKGIEFTERQKALEGYMIDTKGIATMTSGFEKYTEP